MPRLAWGVSPTIKKFARSDLGMSYQDPKSSFWRRESFQPPELLLTRMMVWEEILWYALWSTSRYLEMHRVACGYTPTQSSGTELLSSSTLWTRTSLVIAPFLELWTSVLRWCPRSHPEITCLRAFWHSTFVVADSSYFSGSSDSNVTRQ